MRKCIFLCIIFRFTLSLSAQDLTPKEVPEIVKYRLEEHFPGAKKVQWVKDHGSYVADFFQEKIGISAWFDKSGNLLKTVKGVLFNELPAKARNYISRNFPEENILGTEKITDNTKLVRWKVYIPEKEILFDERGNFLK